MTATFPGGGGAKRRPALIASARMGERTRYEPGAFCWVGLATSDPDAAKGFYTRVFGWQAEDVPDEGLTLLRVGGSDVAILYRQTAEARAAGAPPHWTSFVSVEDADAAAARAEELGGAAVFREPFDVLDAGRVAAIRDPSGAILSLWQPGARSGAALVNDVGAWCWNELATSDVERVKPFYRDLFGWEYEGGEGYTLISHAGRRAGGIREQAEHERGMPPSWLPYFTVEDAGEAARASEAACGRTRVPATEIAIGRFAAVADPQGAVLCLFEGATDP
jgi:uncharacterized protein